MIEKIKNTIKNTKRWKIILWIVVIMSCIPFVFAARYALFKADDFHAITYGKKGLFLQSIQSTIDVWKGWQGTWFSCFVSYLVDPLLWGELRFRILRIYLMLLTTLAFSGAFFCVKSMLDFFDIDKKYIIYFTIAILWPYISYTEYADLYLWYAGASTYLLPLVCLEFGFSLMLLGAKKKSIFMTIGAAILLFCMGGGNLMLPGFGCSAILLINICDILRSKKIKPALLIPFLCALAGAVLNAAAPGNFLRHSVIDDTKISIADTVQFSFSVAFRKMEVLLHETTFPIYMILAILLGFALKKRTTIKYLLLTIIGCLLVPVATVFPFVMGYSYRTINLPNRCLAIADISIIVSMIIMSAHLGIWLGSAFVISEEKVYMFKAMAVSVMVVVWLFAGRSYKDNVVMQVTGNLLEGKIQEYAQDWQTIYAICDNSPVKNLIIEYPLHERVAGCTITDISDDAEVWSNVNAATYFGLDSMALVITDE